RRVCEAGLVEHRARIMEFARPALALSTKQTPEGRIAVGATKFGGRPDLPAGSRWPRCDRGPLEFLAQFDLAELQQAFAGGALLPARGLLSFFMYHNYPEDEYGNGRESPPKHTGGVRILHTPNTSKLARLEPPDDLTEDLGQPKDSCLVTFAEM